MENRFLTIEDLGNLPPPKWLIEDLFEQGSLAMLVGPPGSFKSFLAIDWALCLATGRPWNGRAIEPCGVLYALGEGKASLLKRIEAWCWKNQISKSERQILNANFRITFDVPQLAIPREANEFINDLEEDGFQPGLFIVDTLARSFVGKDENGQTDVGLWVEAADNLRQKGMAVLALHHTKKNTEFGLQYRGSSSWQGAMDTTIILHRDPDGMRGYAKLTCSKQKDHQEFEDIWMKREQVRPPDGDTEGSIVLIEIDNPSAEVENKEEEDSMALSLILESLLDDPTFESDRARARVLAEQAGIKETTAQTKVTRARKRRIDG